MEDKILPGRRAGSGSMAPGCPVSPEKARLHNERRGTHLIFRKGEKNMTMKETLRKKAKGKKGFTLVELVIVIAVLAIIAAIAIPTVTNVINNANSSADQSNAQSIEMAIKTAKAEVAANQTTPSTRVDKLGSGGTLNTLLATYGVDSSVLTSPKISGDTFFYNPTSGKVVAKKTTSVSTTDWKQLDGTVTTYTVASDSLTLSVDPKSADSD